MLRLEGVYRLCCFVIVDCGTYLSPPSCYLAGSNFMGHPERKGTGTLLGPRPPSGYLSRPNFTIATTSEKPAITTIAVS